MDLKEKIKLLPESPGVYLMKDTSGNIIYVGKSKNLKSRVQQYFQNSKNHSPKVIKMVQGIRDFELIITDTEFEALLLECRLVKEIQPMYNSQMKNPGKYVYIEVTINEEYPRILVTTEVIDDGCLYFGPYTSPKNIERATSAIRDIFQVGNCGYGGTLKSNSGCINYQMGLCLGVCADPSLRPEYMDRINTIVAFLGGKSKLVIEVIERKMLEAAERLDFTKAAKYRDDLYALKHIVNKQRVISFSGGSRNIAAVEFIDESAAKLFLLRNSSLLYEEKVAIIDISKETFKNHLKDIIKKNYKFTDSKNSRKVDKENIDQAQIIFSYLKNNKDCIYIPVPAAWLKDDEKLNKGLDKFTNNVYR